MSLCPHGYTGVPFAVCSCVACVRARQHDRRDAVLMLRATRIQGAGVKPAERVKWDAYLEQRHA